MGKAISTKSGIIQLNLSPEQKARMIEFAAEYGHTSVSAFVGAIADGKYRILHREAAMLLDLIVDMRKQLGGER